MKKLAAIAVALLIATGLASPAEAAPQRSVVASAYPLYDVVSYIGGDRLHASDPLTLDAFGNLTPEKAEQLRTASVAVILGGNTQPEVERIAATRSGPTIRVFDELVPRYNGQQLDPYVWMDPSNMMVISELVRAELSTLDRGGQKTYAKRQERYVQQLADTLRRHERTFGTCKRQDFVTLDPRMGYLADRFGLRQIDARGIPLAEIPERTGADTVFDSRLPTLPEAERLLQTTGLKAAVLDPMSGRTDQARRGGANYVNTAALNLDALREALECEKVSLRGEES